MRQPVPVTNDEKIRVEEKKAEAERDYVLMLLILTVSFLVFSLAAAVFVFLNIGLSSAPEPKKDDLLELSENLVAFCLVINNSLNFIFYFIGGKMFRKALFVAIKKKC